MQLIAGSALLACSKSRSFSIFLRMAGRVSPRRATHFLSLRRKKVSKERATLLPVTPTLRAGAACDARSRGVLRNSLRCYAAPFGQPQQVRPRRRVSCGTRPPRALRFSARAEGLGRFRAIAALGLACASQARSELCGAPRKCPDAGLPLRTAKGSQTAGSPFFCLLFFGEVYRPDTWLTGVRGHG